MAGPEGIRVDGLKELQRDIRKAQDKELGKKLRAANKKAADVVKDRAKPEAPVQSGRLAKSVTSKAGQRDAHVKAGTAARVPYAGAIHFGWPRRGIKANRFLNRALWRTREQVGKVYEVEIEDLRKLISSL